MIDGSGGMLKASEIELPNGQTVDEFLYERDQDASVDLEDSSSSAESSSHSSYVSGFSGSTPDANSGNLSSALGSKTDKDLYREAKSAKVIIFLFIVFFAFVGGLTTTYVVRREENESFEDHLVGFAHDIEDRTKVNIDAVFDAMKSLARTITTEGTVKDAGHKFPFVTLPQFEIFGSETRDASSAEVVIYAPLVTEQSKSDWEDYCVKNDEWIVEGLKYEGFGNLVPGPIPDHIHTNDEISHDHKEPLHEAHLENYYLPVWQVSSVPRDTSIINLDLVGDSIAIEHDVVDIFETGSPLLSGMRDLRYLYENSVIATGAQEREAFVDPYNPIALYERPRQSYVAQPVFDSVKGYERGDGQSPDETFSLVGFVFGVFKWEKSIFHNLLPAGVGGVQVVLEDGCGHVSTYALEGNSATYVGMGDLHDPLYDDFVHAIDNLGERGENDFNSSKLHPPIDGSTYNKKYEGTELGHCKYSVRIYPTYEFEELYRSSQHSIYAIFIGVIFVVVIVLLFLYDCIVIGRQRRIIAAAQRTNAIVAQFFPKAALKKIMAQAKEQEEQEKQISDEEMKKLGNEIDREHVNELVAGGVNAENPIADYFPNATIMFADLVGFTAWSSTRDPTQVFKLLESIFRTFDEIAARRRVFKVETVGDCYVAATGLPEKRKDHAVAMARFARECLIEFKKLVTKMEETLGPDTSQLAVRIGIHSGPITAGVLRGSSQRFQLFGDTMNTTARVESTGMPNRIHLSKETAELLLQAGKRKWITLRAEKVKAKGKGELQTYWLDIKRPGRSSSSSGGGSSTRSRSNSDNFNFGEDDQILAHSGHMHPYCNDDGMNELGIVATDKMQRLVKWNAELLLKALKVIVALRTDFPTIVADEEDMLALEEATGSEARLLNDKLVFDEVVEVIPMPPKLHTRTKPTDPDKVIIPENVVDELSEYVGTIMAMYRHDNPFHNFEHASHVAMSTAKLMARIIAPEEATGAHAMKVQTDDMSDAHSSCADKGTMKQHDSTYGITSDPLIPFTAVLSAIIHDVDHPGVPNSTLIAEKTAVAATYCNKSVAEQNSIDLAWDLLMDEQFRNLRRILYVNESEFKHFRQLIVNCVMATDIMDKDLGAARKNRWSKAFSKDAEESSSQMGDTVNDVHRKATIVIEHLIQASDVSHTMQHWHIYRRWNERFFHECYKAYKDGRTDKDPSLNWYKGEIGFFDFYVIPLARKLDNCGVFGVSSDEYLAYATKNREEWEEKGKEMVEEFLESYRELYDEELRESREDSFSVSTFG